MPCREKSRRSGFVNASHRLQMGVQLTKAKARRRLAGVAGAGIPHRQGRAAARKKNDANDRCRRHGATKTGAAKPAGERRKYPMLIISRRLFCGAATATVLATPA